MQSQMHDADRFWTQPVLPDAGLFWAETSFFIPLETSVFRLRLRIQ